MLKVLISDDEASLRFLISETLSLQKDKYQIFEAVDGLEALEKIQSVKPDLIILDVMMPKLSGYQVLEKLQEIGGFEHKVIMLTAKVQPADIEKGMSLGASLYLTKPFSPLDLLNTLNKI